MKDYYEILGLPRSATDTEIKKTFRRLAKQYHPDVNKGDKGAEERFKEISMAYDVLGDSEKKKKYDRYGHMGDQPGFDPNQFRQGFRSQDFGGGFEGFQNAGGQSGFNLNDILENFMGGGRGRRPGRGQSHVPQPTDVQASIEIDFEDAVFGSEKSIRISSDAGPQKLKIKIPAGIRNGGKIRLAGKGENGGSLYIQIGIRPHTDFWREDDDLYIEIPITIIEAALGTTVKVPIFDTAVNLKIPPGTASGQKFRMSGKGVTRLGKSGNGDLYVLMKVVVPPNLDSESKELLKQVQEKSRYNPRE